MSDLSSRFVNDLGQTRPLRGGDNRDYFKEVIICHVLLKYIPALGNTLGGLSLPSQWCQERIREGICDLAGVLEHDGLSFSKVTMESLPSTSEC